MKSTKVSLLHVSDVHFGCSDDAGTQDRVLDALQAAVELGDTSIDAVVFTGDLSQSSASSEYVQAQDWLVRLSEAAKAPCLVIPGNHDSRRASADKKVLRSAYQDAESYGRWKDDIFKSHDHIEPFLTWFRSAKREHSFLLNSWDTNPSIDTVRVTLGGIRCLFICLNTALLSCDDHDDEKLCIDLKGLNGALAKKASDNNLIIALGHHPTENLAPWNRTNFEKILQQETGPHAYLHGHLHAQAGNSSYSITGQGIITCASGAAYPGAIYRKFFSILTIDLASKELIPTVYEFHEDSGRWLPQPGLSRKIPVRVPNIEKCTDVAASQATNSTPSEGSRLLRNPFADVVANGLPPDAVHGLFVKQTGSLVSLKNHVDTIVEGQRGTGKTMLLRYFSVEVQCSMLLADSASTTDAIQQFRSKTIPLGVYCCLTNAGVNRSDLEVLSSDARRRAVFEHITALFILSKLLGAARTLAANSHSKLLAAADYGFLARLLRVADQTIREREVEALSLLLDEIELHRMSANEHLASLLPGGTPTNFNPWLDLANTLFSTIDRIKQSIGLTAPVFLLLDDFDQLSREQQEILFNAAAARRHDVVCYKFGIMSEGQKAFMSATERTYREGDDYNFVRLDWVDGSLRTDESPSSYTKTIDEIVARRMARAGWPASVTLASLLDTWEFGSKVRDEARQLAEAEYQSMPPDRRPQTFKSLWDKQANARYFRLLAKRRTFHRYAGKPTIIELSSGIFRQFLELCSGIVDLSLSDPRWSPTSGEKIGVDKQNRAVREWSRDMYRHLGNSGDVSALRNRSQVVTSQHLINLATSLSRFFQAKLLSDSKDPEAIAIAVTGTLSDTSFSKALLDVAVRESVLQRRSVDYTGKSGTGDRFPTYLLNRRLVPYVGLGTKLQGRHELSAELLELAAKKPDAFLLKTIGDQGSGNQASLPL